MKKGEIGKREEGKKRYRDRQKGGYTLWYGIERARERKRETEREPIHS